MIDGHILAAVRRIERLYALEHTTVGVFPYQVQAFLDVYRNESTLRRDMARLAKWGLLERVGGDGTRRGYRSRLRRVECVPVIEIKWSGVGR